MFFLNTRAANTTRAPKTKRMQMMTQAEIEVRPSTFGELFVIVFKMLMRTRKRVTSRVNRPATASGGIKKLAWKEWWNIKGNILYSRLLGETKIIIKILLKRLIFCSINWMLKISWRISSLNLKGLLNASALWLRTKTANKKYLTANKKYLEQACQIQMHKLFITNYVY